MHTDTLSTAAVPLNKLLNDDSHNVRTTASAEGIEELAASIAAVGLLQSLVVRQQPRGKFAVVAGHRRLAALALLVKNGTLKSNWPVPCRVTPTNADLTEIGLTENVMRVPMHPADELVAFEKLIADGKCVADVAARFGVTEALVNRRLALARVSPVLLQQYRDGLLNLETLQAFTLTDDHVKQEEIWAGLQQWNRNARTVRQMLSEDAIPATDPRARFLGVENYEAAGGLVRRDLFSDEDQGIRILDPAKLTRLVSEKLDALASRAQAKGWKWVEVQSTLDHAAIARLRRIQPQPVPLSAKAEAKLQKLEEKRVSLESQLSEVDEDANERIYRQVDEIDEALSKIEDSRQTVYPDEVKRNTGVVVSIGHDGEPFYVYGLLRKEDEKGLMRQIKAEDSPAPEADTVTVTNERKEETPPAAYPAPVIESLTMYKTAAIAAELAQQPGIALAAIVHALVLRHFGMDLNLYRAETSIQISLSRPSLDGAVDSFAVVQLERQRQEWLTQLPRTASELWQWCLDQDQDMLLRLLAFLTAISVNAIQAVRLGASESDGKYRRGHADQLAAALHVDMTQWFTPTASNLFGKVSKSQTLAALQEAGKTVPDAAKLKKAELADVAEREFRSSGWLPIHVRVEQVAE